MLPIELKSETTRAPMNAGRNPSTLNPGKKTAINQKRSAFRINVKRPSVTIVRGNVIRKRIGLSVTFITPRISATISATLKLSTSIPGTMFATKRSENTVSRNRAIIFIQIVIGHGHVLSLLQVLDFH